MKNSIFSRMAWMGIKKNRRFYVPYILTCICMIMMFYIIDSLYYCPLLMHMSGGGELRLILGIGRFVIIIFAAIFLFYTNSFLIRRRNKEFGLYNILGMDKKNVSRIILRESVMVSVGSIGIGLVIGIVCSKLAELGLINMLHKEVDYTFRIPPKALLETLVFFAIIFVLLFFNAVSRVAFSKPIELLRSENTGEKAPKGNWILALLGIVMLTTAYIMAIEIENPISAISFFFVAVVLVIVASYLLFIAGSVSACQLLKKNKGYYYKANHFVSVSSMAYRMKRNGAGLASICILSTMVLVMISSSASLYFGMDDLIGTRNPADMQIGTTMLSAEGMEKENLEAIKQYVKDLGEKNGSAFSNEREVRTYSAIGVCENDVLSIGRFDIMDVATEDNVCELFFVPLEDYNNLCNVGKAKDNSNNGTLQDGNGNVELGENEILLLTNKKGFKEDTLKIENVGELKVKKCLYDIPKELQGDVPINDFYVIMEEPEKFLKEKMYIDDEEKSFINSMDWSYYFDISTGDKKAESLISDIRTFVFDPSVKEQCKIESTYISNRAEMRDNFYIAYGGLFFIGILLSIVFVLATILIIYYKQISEGYEDQSRFEIMQNVGMTKKEIKQSINSQVLTVFSLPVLFAGLHLTFAFPMVWRILLVFGLHNKLYVILVNIISFLAFAAIYSIIYKVTSNGYYSIVSDGEER